MTIKDDLNTINKKLDAVIATQGNPTPVTVDLTPVLNDTSVIKADTAAIRAELVATP